MKLTPEQRAKQYSISGVKYYSGLVELEHAFLSGWNARQEEVDEARDAAIEECMAIEWSAGGGSEVYHAMKALKGKMIFEEE